MKKFLILAATSALMVACSESPTSPQRSLTASNNRLNRALLCSSGYIIAFDENSNPYCAPDPDVRNLGRPKRRP